MPFPNPLRWLRRRARLAETILIEPDFAPPAPRDRLDYDREDLLRQALEAWRTNPIARRVVELTSQYVVGGGLTLRSPHPGVNAFLQRWWHHPLNQGPQRILEWCDELTRSGELYFLLSSDAEGLTYVRAVPALQVARLETAENDLAQETAAWLRPAETGFWRAERRVPIESAETAAALQPALLHFAVNRPVGAVHGESDLAPLLRWLARYTAWLEDRARLNRYRNAFYYVVHTRFNSETERRARQAALAAHPPTPGSILVVDESETWETVSPRLESREAAADGLALKKMIAVGAGLPLHFLAEPEDSTRTTAEAAGGPAFRRLEQRQQFFLRLVETLARAALARWVAVHPLSRLPNAAGAQIDVRGADLTSRDNGELARAAAETLKAWLPLVDRGLLPPDELLRLAYRFAGEVADVDDLLHRAGG